MKTILIIFLLGLLGFVCQAIEITDSTNQNNEPNNSVKELQFGVYSSLSVYRISRISNGIFVAKNRFRLIGLIDVSRFYPSYPRKTSICGGQLQLDYSLNRKKLSPYIAINFSHLRYTIGSKHATSHQYSNPKKYEPSFNVFSYGAQLIGGVETKIIKGIAIMLQIGAGLELRNNIARPDKRESAILGPTKVKFMNQSYDDNRMSFTAGAGIKINVAEFL